MLGNIGRIFGGIIGIAVMVILIQLVYKPVYQAITQTMPQSPQFPVPSYLDPNTLSLIVVFFGIVAIAISIIFNSSIRDDYEEPF